MTNLTQPKPAGLSFKMTEAFLRNKHDRDKRIVQMPHEAIKNKVDFFVSGLTITLIEAYSRQTI